MLLYFDLIAYSAYKVILALHMNFVYCHCTVQPFKSCTSRPDLCQCQVLHTTMDNMSKHKPTTPMTPVTGESNLRSVVRSSMHPCQGNWVAIERTGVNNAWNDCEFSAGIKCLHCILYYFCTLASHLLTVGGKGVQANSDSLCQPIPPVLQTPYRI